MPEIDETTEVMNQLYGDLLAVNAARGTPQTPEDSAHKGSLLVSCTHYMTGVDPHPDHDGPQTVVALTLTDIMHFCDFNGVDFRAALMNAKFNFKNDIRGTKDYA